MHAFSASAHLRTTASTSALGLIIAAGMLVGCVDDNATSLPTPEDGLVAAGEKEKALTADVTPDCMGSNYYSLWSLESMMGDGSCQAWLNCEQFDWDDGDCVDERANNAASTCLSGSTRDCIEACMPLSLLGDDDCDYRFNCAEFNFDEGDCPLITWGTGSGEGNDGCDADEVEDCTGGCKPASWIDDNYCDISLNCAATDYDGGDCAEEAEGCSAGQIDDCDGGCKPASWIDDGYCDGALDCLATDYDGGDCTTPAAGCASNQVKGCDGSCVSASWVNDNECDAVLRCEQTDFDGGDCEPVECAADAVANCAQNRCVPAWWPGDGFCDYELNCAATGHDGGDCN